MDESSELFPTQLPNPFTPLAFLPPELAYQKSITTYILVGMLGVLVWDILIHLGADYKLLVRHRISLPTTIYFTSRWSCLVYTILSILFETAQIENCTMFSKITCAMYHPAVSTTALLFFFRVRAVYDRNKYITTVFLVLWLAALGSSLVVITSLTGASIGNTKYCTFVAFQPYGSSSNIAIAVFDTCVFAAISWRLLANAPPAGVLGRTSKVGLFGKYLPRFSRALLQDGQKYYMVAMVCNLTVLVMNYTPGVPTTYRPLFLLPSVGLTNIMACRVFRNTKLGHYDEASTAGTINAMFKHSTPVHSQHTQLVIHSNNEGGIHNVPTSDREIVSGGNSPKKIQQLSKAMSIV